MSKVNRLLKKAHLLRCARSPRSNVSVNTPPLVDFSRASHLDLFEQPGIIVFQQALTYDIRSARMLKMPIRAEQSKGERRVFQQPVESLTRFDVSHFEFWI